MKKFFPALISLIIFAQLCTQAQDNVIDEVIWIVGDDAILRSDVENWRLQMQIGNQRLKGDPYCIIPEQLAIQKLYLHQAKLDSIEISENQVAMEVESRINNAINQVGSKEKLEEYLTKPISSIREIWKQTVREQALVNEMQKKLVGSIKVTPSEVRSFFNRIPQDSLPYIPTTVEVEIITLEPLVSLAEIDDIKKRLREYTEQVTSGQREFSTLARLWSEDIESARRGGELGFLGKGSLLPEFATVAFELNDPKKVSRIVETEYGYHIIQLIEKRGDRINVRHLLLRPKVSKEELEEARHQLDSVRTDIVNAKFTFEEAATYLSHDKDTRNNKGLMVNQNQSSSSNRSGTSRFEMDELPPEISRVIYNMKVGDISPVFTMINSKQKNVVAIVKLKSKIEGHKADLSEDFQELKAMVQVEKEEALINEWVSNKIKETYVRINENWKNCDFQMKNWINE
ncbi:MAG: peptidylprolyl isomerase [Dysgonamonadaceae bacterium]|jgi:peptidyl-prolyl cis-trans isomerase SurA|nr:peptidylprolyl isomerase [Dysgonamonadaceae bacterium]